MLSNRLVRVAPSCFVDPRMPPDLMHSPETRPSLLLRIRDRDDRESWEEFVALYRPIVVALAWERGLQDADAEDLAQQVLIAISGAIDRFDPQSRDARFRTWLQTIARNAIINAITRRKPDLAVGGSAIADWLQQRPEETPETRSINLSYRRQIFIHAAEAVREECSEASWACFWETAVVGRPAIDVAQELDRSIGSVYTARSRVMKRLRIRVSELDQGHSVVDQSRHNDEESMP